MSHPAIVAYENGDGTFDLHYSRNGAERYQLKEVLEGYLDGEYEKLGGEMPALLPNEVAEFTHEGMEIAEHDIIESDPITDSIKPEEIHQSIPDIRAEILYVVQDWQVDVFSIVPVTPSLTSLLAEHIDLEIFDFQELEISPQSVMLSEGEPTLSMSGDDFFDSSFYEEMSGPEYTGFSHYHLDLLNGVLRCAHEQNSESSVHQAGNILHESWAMNYQVKNPTPIPWSPILVEVWSGDEDSPNHGWQYDSKNPGPRGFANELRLELSVAAVRELGDFVELARSDARNGYIYEKFWETQTRELARFITLLLDRFGDSFSQKFSDTELVGEILTDSLAGRTFQFGDSVIRTGPNST